MSPVATAPAHLRARDAQLRAAYLREVLDLLYPAPCFTDGAPGDDTDGRVAGTAVADYLVVPDARRPRLLVPARSRRIAAAAVRRYAEPQSRIAKLKRDAVVTALRSGASGLLLRDRIRVYGPDAETIDGYLRRVLGADVALSIHIGPARANRKPVLQLIARDGRTVGFGKMGTGPLTRRLVRAETSALQALSHAVVDDVTIPSVLHSGEWRGHQVLIQSALPVWQPRAPLSAERLAAAQRAVALCCGTSKGWLSTSPYWSELRERLAGVADRPDGAALAAAARDLAARAGDTDLRFGSWHGDWAPWNMAALAGSLLVWDWERFTLGVPMGFDALHYELQRRIQTDPDAAAAVERTVTRAPRLLAPFEVPRAAAELTALLYLIDLAARYLADRQAEAGARLGVLGTWLLPVLVRRVEAFR
ncbi:hypothetical protein SAMN05421812_102233 [Asanoa hainanensis]|uniref:Phosphotransferase enzyme family protein n=1 Tax=Asanoa hainanensis TaxID=560556 RepID=A0A239I507_9ACTN|nr:hypothetical protein [Asanoa hainanensis]SNS88956.1 hypothetical protein SAMN05421812_102233 [Asanoa hainanensis]